MLSIYALIFVIDIVHSDTKVEKQLAIASFLTNLALALTPDNQPSHLITLPRQQKQLFTAVVRVLLVDYCEAKERSEVGTPRTNDIFDRELNLKGYNTCHLLQILAAAPSW